MNLDQTRIDSQCPERHRLFIEIQNQCPLCETDLTIHVLFKPDAQSLVENAECPKCGVTTRTMDHFVH